MSDPQTTWEFMVEVCFSGMVRVEAETREEAIEQARTEWAYADLDTGSGDLIAIFEKHENGVYEEAWMPSEDGAA